MTKPSIAVINVVTPEGPKDYVALTSPDVAFSAGLIPEAILGVLKRPLDPDEAIAPDNFISNSVFSKFLQHVIAKYGPEDPDLQAEAVRIGKGSVVLVDQRTPTPEGPVPPEDIVGVFEIEDAKVGPGGYFASPKHQLLTKNGFFRLDAWLEDCLQRELTALATAPKPERGAG